MSANRQRIIVEEDDDGMLMVLISSSSRAHAAWFALMVTLQTNASSADKTRMHHGLHATSKYNVHAIFMYWFIK